MPLNMVIFQLSRPEADLGWQMGGLGAKLQAERVLLESEPAPDRHRAGICDCEPCHGAPWAPDAWQVLDGCNQYRRETKPRAGEMGDSGALWDRPGTHGPKTRKAPETDAFAILALSRSGAGEGIRTLDPNLGKGVLYP